MLLSLLFALLRACERASPADAEESKDEEIVPKSRENVNSRREELGKEQKKMPSLRIELRKVKENLTLLERELRRVRSTTKLRRRFPHDPGNFNSQFLHVAL